MIDGNTPLGTQIYVWMAAIAGSVTSLSSRNWKEMSWGEKGLTLFVGASFAMFVTPWLAHTMIGVNEGDARTVAGITYAMAAGSNTLLPLLLKGVSGWIARVFGKEAGQ